MMRVVLAVPLVNVLLAGVKVVLLTIVLLILHHSWTFGSCCC